MSEPRKKYRTHSAGRGGKKEHGRTQELVKKEHGRTQELVLTLSVRDGEVVKVEMLEKSGQRKELSEEELAGLAGDDDISPEEVYAAGIDDPNVDDEFEFDDDEAFERLILRELIAHQLLRRGMRRFVVRRGRKRDVVRQQPSMRRAQKAEYEDHKNGHERSRTGG